MQLGFDWYWFKESSDVMDCKRPINYDHWFVFGKSILASAQMRGYLSHISNNMACWRRWYLSTDYLSLHRNCMINGHQINKGHMIRLKSHIATTLNLERMINIFIPEYQELFVHTMRSRCAIENMLQESGFNEIVYL